MHSAAVSEPPHSAAPILEIAGVEKRFGATVVLAGVSLTVQGGEFFTLLGPSGCGKTTLLRLIAGLDDPDAGEVRIQGRVTRDWPAHDRPVNTVFQSYALFPHLNVRDNVAFGLRMKRRPELEIQKRVQQVLELVKTSELALRKPAQLSGGQKQRVALARAIVNQPKILLLDEPLAALDLSLRQQLQEELRPLQRSLGMTFLYVTHDQDEAFTLSDRIAILNRGKLEQLGEPRELYHRPRNRFVAQFLGGCTVIEGRRDRDSVDTSLGLLQLKNAPNETRQGSCWVGIRPEEIQFAEERESATNLVRGVVREVRHVGAETRWQIEAGGILLRVVSLAGQHEVHTAQGEPVVLRLPPSGLRVWTE